jgi:seryl-tRNA synthetase
MATSHIQTKCSICNQETCTFICTGCSTGFCFHHLTEHRQTLQTKLQDIQNDFNQFRQTIIEQINQPEKRSTIEKINQWEINSIEKIKQTAKECREILSNYTNTILDEIKLKLDDPNEQPIITEGKNDFNEIHLNKFQEKLNQLKEKLLDQSKNILIKQPAISFINQIYIQFGKFTYFNSIF